MIHKPNNVTMKWISFWRYDTVNVKHNWVYNPCLFCVLPETSDFRLAHSILHDIHSIFKKIRRWTTFVFIVTVLRNGWARICTFNFCSVGRLFLFSQMSRSPPKFAQSMRSGVTCPRAISAERAIDRFAWRLASAAVTHFYTLVIL
jgi:hypothetical protein